MLSDHSRLIETPHLNTIPIAVQILPLRLVLCFCTGTKKHKKYTSFFGLFLPGKKGSEADDRPLQILIPRYFARLFQNTRKISFAQVDKRDFLDGRSGETCMHFSLAGDAKNQRIRQCAHWLMHRPPACAITRSSLATMKQKQGAFAPCFCLVGVARLELAASWSRTMRATSCATPRKAYSL